MHIIMDHFLPIIICHNVFVSFYFDLVTKLVKYVHYVPQIFSAERLFNIKISEQAQADSSR